jgi:outer membrane lipoprotein-sorting protein
MSTATYIAEETGPQGIVAVARVKAPHQLRLDFQEPSASVSVSNGSTGEMFSYSAASDEVKVTAISKAGANFDILQLLINPDVDAVKSNDANNIADTQLFDIFDGKGRIWVSLQSNLPVRIEMPSPTQQGTTKRIYRDFEWNVPLDDELFALPTGKRTVRGTTLASPTELELIAAFAIRQAFSQQPYEESFLAKSSKPGLRVSQLAYDQSKGPQENFQLQSSKLRDHWATLGISESEARDPALVQQRIDYLSMKLDDWASTIAFKGGWVGKGVRPGETKPLLWWRSEDRIRVLLADLTIIESESPPASD